MNSLDALILGILEGITEFLPISSTGHLILASHLLNISQTNFFKTFEIAIQFGAILSVVILYFRSLFLNWEILKRIFVAFIPTAVIGLIFYSFIKTYLLSSELTVIISLFLGGLFLIFFEKSHHEKDNSLDQIEKLSYKKSLLIGLFQSIAIIPGVSRAAATIVGGLIVGLKRKTVVEFSFLLAVPTMAAATGFDLIKNATSISGPETSLLLIGFITAFVSALLGVKFLLKFIKNHSFTAFGYYRIILAIVFFAFLFS